MYYIFYKTDDNGDNASGAHLYQDITPLSLQQGDEISIEWDLGIPNFDDTQLPLVDSNGNTMTWSAASFPGSKVKVIIFGGDDGSGTAYGTIITHAHMLSNIGGSGGNFFDESYNFTRTLGSGVGSIFTTDTSKFNTIRFNVINIEEGETFFIDDVSFGSSVTTTNNWSFGNAVNSSGTVTISDGGMISQVLTSGIDSSKTQRIEVDVASITGHPTLSIVGLPITLGGSPLAGSGFSVDNVTFQQDIPAGQYIGFTVFGGTVSIGSISIKELNPIGGSVDHWDLNGGVNTNSIYTHQTPTGDEKIVFNNAPPNTYLHQNLTNTNSILDWDAGTKVKVKFNLTNYSGSGELKFRFYNSDTSVAEGFEYTAVPGLNQFTGTIGSNDSIDFVSKFGFYVSSVSTFSGEIDSVSMTIDGEGAGRTITFNEQSKGWTSFKSFIPEFGLSSVNQYYTMSLGQLWKHHTNETRNTFYDLFTESSITPILNTQPALVKNFNTLNYEGTQSKVDIFTTDPATGFTDGQYYNLYEDTTGLGYISGWYVEDIHTDKQEGTLNEFIEKEGKWFNYIKGKQGEIDTAAFNFQGLGTVDSILQPGCTNPNATNFDPNAPTDDGSCTFLPGAFEMQIRDITSPTGTNGAARVVYAGTNVEATGFIYAWTNGETVSEVTGLGMGPIGCTITDGQGSAYIPTHVNPSLQINFVSAYTVDGCTDPNATNYNYSANTDDGTCAI